MLRGVSIRSFHENYTTLAESAFVLRYPASSVKLLERLCHSWNNTVTTLAAIFGFGWIAEMILMVKQRRIEGHLWSY